MYICMHANMSIHILTKINDWDHNVKVDGVECPVDCVRGEEVVQMLN